MVMMMMMKMTEAVRLMGNSEQMIPIDMLSADLWRESPQGFAELRRMRGTAYENVGAGIYGLDP